MSTKLIPYFVINRALDAIEFYQSLFDAKLIVRRKMTPDMGKRHALPDDFDYERSTMEAMIEIFGNPVLLTDAREKAKVLGCKVKMELQEKFQGKHHAHFVDPFGIGWFLNYDAQKES